MRKPTRVRSAILSVLQSAAVSCSTHDSTAAEALPQRSMKLAIIDQTQWHPYAAFDDPLPEHEPAMIQCGPAGFYLTPLSSRPKLEIDTAYCNYALLYAEALVPLSAGVELSFELRHFDLVAEQPAQAHVALFLDRTLDWETYIAIPSPAEVTTFSWHTQRAIHQGEPIRLHLHNHGQNTWVIAKLTASVIGE